MLIIECSRLCGEMGNCVVEVIVSVCLWYGGRFSGWVWLM